MPVPVSAVLIERALAWCSVPTAAAVLLAYALGFINEEWTLVSARRRAVLMSEHSTTTMAAWASLALVAHAFLSRREADWMRVVATPLRAMLFLVGVTERALDVEVLVVWIVAWCNLHPIIVAATVGWSVFYSSSWAALQIGLYCVLAALSVAQGALDYRRKTPTDPLPLCTQHALATLALVGLAARA